MLFSNNICCSVLFLLFLLNSTVGVEYEPLTISVANQIVRIIRGGLEDTSISQQCQSQLNVYTNGLKGSEKWANSMFDATTKFQTGVLVGNLIDMGHFDQCLDIEYESKEVGKIQGRHCMVYAHKKIENLNTINSEQMTYRLDSKAVNLGFGVCLPSSCSPEDVRILLETTLSFVNMTLAEYEDNSVCNIKETIVFNAGDWTAIFIFSIFLALLTVGTVYDLAIQFILPDKTGAPLLLAFSVFSNGKKLFKLTSNKTNDDTIHCIHGIRAITIIWIVFCHRYVVSLSFPIYNSAYAETWIKSYSTTIVTGATVSVDTFLVLSGLLLSYIFLKHTTVSNKINIPTVYLHRYLRITPAFAAMILFQATLMIYVSSGPYWKQRVSQFQENCVNYWWLGLLYLQNYVHSNSMCVGHSWYLSLDMQLFILSPILLWPLFKWPKQTIVVISSLIVASVGIAFTIVYVNDYSSSPFLVKVHNYAEIEKNLYLPTHTRYGPWLLGLLFGYFLHKTRNVTVTMKKAFVALIWLAALTIMLATVIGIYPLQQVDHVHNTLESALFSSFRRILWAAGVCWIIYACKIGYGGPINWFLSLSFWQPISRLSYCIYIIHFPLQFLMASRMRTAPYYVDVDVIYNIWGDLGMTITVAIVWSLAFEAPVLMIEKIFTTSANANNTHPSVEKSRLQQLIERQKLKL